MVSAIACTIAKCCSENDITILAAVFTQLGDTLATILAKRELSEKTDNNIGQNGQNSNDSCGKDDDQFLS